MGIRDQSSIIRKSDRENYDRLELKNGWDPQDGSPPPLTGRKKETARAYELLVEKSDDEYRRSAEETRRIREEREYYRDLQAARQIVAASKWFGQDQSVMDPRDGTKNGTEESVGLRGQSDADAIGETPTEEIFRGMKITSRESVRGRKLKIAAIALAAIIVLFGAADARIAFGSAVTFADVSAYENTPIQIEGLTEKSFDITAEDLKKMKMSQIHVDAYVGELTDEELPERGRAVGPTLEVFLEEYGRSVDEFRSMKVYTDSGRSTAYVRTMKEETILLSVANGNHRLGPKEAPLRIAVAGEDPGEWSGGIRRIVFTEE